MKKAWFTAIGFCLQLLYMTYFKVRSRYYIETSILFSVQFHFFSLWCLSPSQKHVDTICWPRCPRIMSFKPIPLHQHDASQTVKPSSRVWVSMRQVIQTFYTIHWFLIDLIQSWWSQSSGWSHLMTSFKLIRVLAHDIKLKLSILIKWW